MTQPGRMRLLVAHIVPAPDFVSLILAQDIKPLRGRVDSTVYCSDGPPVKSLREDGWDIRLLDIRRKVTPFRDLRALWRLSMALRREKFDVVVGYTPKGGLLSALAGGLAGRPSIYCCVGLMYTPGMPAWRKALAWALDFVTHRLSSCTIFLSRDDMEYSVAHKLCNSRRARHVGSGIDLARFDRDAQPGESSIAVRERYSLRPGSEIVLTVARFVPAKGFAELARAAAQVVRERAGVHFIWVAPALTGEESVLSSALVAHYGLEGHVTLLGFQADVATLYAAADLLVHPSHREGVPRVLLEAAATGLPIVATDIAGNREIVRDGVTGSLVPVRDADALAAAILRLLADRELATRLAEAARADVRRRYGQLAFADRVARVYAELAGASRLHPAESPKSAPRTVV